MDVPNSGDENESAVGAGDQHADHAGDQDDVSVNAGGEDDVSVNAEGQDDRSGDSGGQNDGSGRSGGEDNTSGDSAGEDDGPVDAGGEGNDPGDSGGQGDGSVNAGGEDNSSGASRGQDDGSVNAGGEDNDSGNSVGQEDESPVNDGGEDDGSRDVSPVNAGEEEDIFSEEVSMGAAATLFHLTLHGRTFFIGGRDRTADHDLIYRPRNFDEEEPANNENEGQPLANQEVAEEDNQEQEPLANQEVAEEENQEEEEEEEEEDQEEEESENENDDDAPADDDDDGGAGVQQNGGGGQQNGGGTPPPTGARGPHSSDSSEGGQVSGAPNGVPNGRCRNLYTKEVKVADDCMGEEVEKLVASCGVLLLENVRFYKEEEKNPASLAHLYVTAGVAKFLKPGFLMHKKLDYLVGAVSNPKKPAAAIVGGSKVGVMESLLAKVNILILFTFYKAQGLVVGSSLVDGWTVVIWNGQVGVFVLKKFAAGTEGWAVRAREAKLGGTFACDYVGEPEAYERFCCGYLDEVDAEMNDISKMTQGQGSFMIDATNHGNVSRYISCSRNPANDQVLV